MTLGRELVPMTRELPDAIQDEARQGHSHAEAADQDTKVNQHEQREDAVRPYLWTALMSLWQAGAR